MLINRKDEYYLFPGLFPVNSGDPFCKPEGPVMPSTGLSLFVFRAFSRMDKTHRNQKNQKNHPNQKWQEQTCVSVT